MENFRSMSCREGSMQFGGGNKVHPPTNMQDLRSYSTNTYNSNQQQMGGKQEIGNTKVKKNKSCVNGSKGWSFNDPEIQRKKRVASYKVYAVEGKMKGSFKKSFRWVKSTCSHVVHGLW